MNWIFFPLVFYGVVFFKRVIKPYLIAGRAKAKFKAYRNDSCIYIPKYPIVPGTRRVMSLRGIPYHWYRRKLLRQGRVLIDQHIWDIVEIDTSQLKNPFVYKTFNEVQFNALLRETANHGRYLG